MCISPKFKHSLLPKKMAIKFLEERVSSRPTVMADDYVCHKQEFHNKQTWHGISLPFVLIKCISDRLSTLPTWSLWKARPTNKETMEGMLV